MRGTTDCVQWESLTSNFTESQILKEQDREKDNDGHDLDVCVRLFCANISRRLQQQRKYGTWAIRRFIRIDGKPERIDGQRFDEERHEGREDDERLHRVGKWRLHARGKGRQGSHADRLRPIRPCRAHGEGPWHVAKRVDELRFVRLKFFRLKYDWIIELEQFDERVLQYGPPQDGKDGPQRSKFHGQ